MAIPCKLPARAGQGRCACRKSNHASNGASSRLLAANVCPAQQPDPAGTDTSEYASCKVAIIKRCGQVGRKLGRPLTRIGVPTGSRSSTLQAVWNGRVLGEREDVVVVKGDSHSQNRCRIATPYTAWAVR
jgi:hypothetical protein